MRIPELKKGFKSIPIYLNSSKNLAVYLAYKMPNMSVFISYSKILVTMLISPSTIAFERGVLPFLSSIIKYGPALSSLVS